jgi:hypothetical protein
MKLGSRHCSRKLATQNQLYGFPKDFQSHEEPWEQYTRLHQSMVILNQKEKSCGEKRS